METKIQDAVCILPRIEMLGNYLEEEIDRLEKHLQITPQDKYAKESFMRIRQLMWISEEISQQVFNEVNEIIGG